MGERDQSLIRDREFPAAEPAHGILERAAQQLHDVVDRQRAQHVHARARQQRADDFERRIFGGGADERERAVFDVRQERVLLGLVEAMHLVEEQHGAAAAFGAHRRACSTASRMSLTPAKTAESCMNSASAWRAISRASVVLPVPGGPQRISEWSWPRSSACRSGLPAPRPVADPRIRRACADACGPRAAAAHRRAQRRAGNPVDCHRRAGSFRPPCALTTRTRAPASARARTRRPPVRRWRRWSSRERRAHRRAAHRA